MKKKLFVFTSLLTTASVAIFTLSSTTSSSDKLLLENIAALADDPAVGWIAGEGVTKCLLKGEPAPQSCATYVCGGTECKQERGLQTPLNGGRLIDCP
jgi:hypothetical protein